jgi:hypothetical protein
VRRLALGLGVLALTACGTSWHTFHANGISVRYPPDWFATSRPLTYVTSPSQALAVASYHLPRDNSGADGCEPKEALDRLPPSGAFIYGWEYRRPSQREGFAFPPRPAHFALTGFANNECLGPSYEMRFRQAGRFFQIHVVFGKQASFITRRTVLRVLDSFEAR